MGNNMGVAVVKPLEKLTLTPEIVRQIAELDEFKGRWQSLSKNRSGTAFGLASRGDDRVGRVVDANRRRDLVGR